jgi:hypothetical protein
VRIGVTGLVSISVRATGDQNRIQYLCGYINSRDSRKLKFLIDTGAEISVIRSSSVAPEVEYQRHKGMEIKGISNTVMKTLGKIDFKTVYLPTHMRPHTLSMF